MLEVTDLLRRAMGMADGGAERGRADAGRYDPSPARPPVVVWNVCRHCNMRCPHCYAAASMRPAPDDLSPEEARRLVDDLAAAGVRIVIFSGGEPLLRPDLVDLIARARDRGIAPQLSTNGVLLDEATVDRLAAAGTRYVGVSLDGLRRFNDAYRGLPGGFERASRGLRRAKAAGMRTGLRVTLTRRNVDQVEPLLRHALDLDVDRFYVSHLLYAGRGRGLIGDDLAPAESRALLLRLFERAEGLIRDGARVGVVTGGNDSDGVLLLRWVEARYGAPAARRVRARLERRRGNSAGEGIVAIDSRGRVHPDQFWAAMTLGDVRTQSFAEILAHPMRAELRAREARLEGRCGACAYRALCRGSHRERALAATGRLWDPDPACVLTDDEIGAAPVAAGGLG